VFDPAGARPLDNVLVYVPGDPSDPGLQPFPPGIACGYTAAGSPLVSTTTAPDGTFTLTGVPVGGAIPIVIQLGRWRRQFTVPVTTACGPNSVPASTTLSMPQNHSQGDMPRIAIVTGALDPVECALLDFGIEQGEFTDPGKGGYINFFTANDPTNPQPGEGGPGATLSSETPGQDALFAQTGGGADGTAPLIDDYDIVILECEGYQEVETAAQQADLAAYLAAGGQVYGSDYIYDWFYENPALEAAANWTGDHSGNGYAVTSIIDQAPESPSGADLQQWLETVGVSTAGSGTVSMVPAFPNVLAVNSPGVEWLFTDTPEGTTGGAIPVHFTFNTPVGASPASQCGQVSFADWHVFSDVVSYGTTFPAACSPTTTGLSPQVLVLEYLLFDLHGAVSLP
jgi:hypothetical protein